MTIFLFIKKNYEIVIHFILAKHFLCKKTTSIEVVFFKKTKII